MWLLLLSFIFSNCEPILKLLKSRVKKNRFDPFYIKAFILLLFKFILTCFVYCDLERFSLLHSLDRDCWVLLLVTFTSNLGFSSPSQDYSCSLHYCLAFDHDLQVIFRDKFQSVFKRGVTVITVETSTSDVGGHPPRINSIDGPLFLVVLTTPLDFAVSRE